MIRAYEPRGNRGISTFSVHRLLKATAIHRCDLLERTERALVCESGDWAVDFTPYEIVTLRAKIELGPDATPLPRSSGSAQSFSSFENISQP